MWSENQQRTKGWLSSDAIGKMFDIDEQGLVQLKLGGALYVAPDGKIRIRLGSTLSEGPGSPIELNAMVSPDRIDQIESTISADSATTRGSISSLQAAILSEIVDRAVADAALQAQIDDHETRVLVLEGEARQWTKTFMLMGA